MLCFQPDHVLEKLGPSSVVKALVPRLTSAPTTPRTLRGLETDCGVRREVSGRDSASAMPGF